MLDTVEREGGGGEERDGWGSVFFHSVFTIVERLSHTCEGSTVSVQADYPHYLQLWGGGEKGIVLYYMNEWLHQTCV